MKHPASRLFRAATCTAGAALCALAGIAAADESEIFVGTGNAVANQRPNILFIMDTSGSMNSNVVTQVPFDPAFNYSGNSSCDDRIFYRQGSNSSVPPSCNDSNSVPAANFKCNAALQQMAFAGFYVADRAAQWLGSPRRWRAINGSNAADAWVECRADAGVHGNGVNLTKLWAADGSNGPWSSNSGQAIGWNANGADSGYVFYTGNYIKWLNSGGTIIQTRLEIMQDVATRTIDQLAASDSVNLGLMRFSHNTNSGCPGGINAGPGADGGMVLREIGSVATNAALMKSDIAALDDPPPDTSLACTPLSETMHEAYLYLSGGAVNYGLASRRWPGTQGGVDGLQPSILSSRQPGNTGVYKSPLLESCQRNFIVLLTDGQPTADNRSDNAIQSLIGGNCAGGVAGRCLEEMAQYMYENDLRPTLPGMQNVTTYTIGFDLGANHPATPVLRNTASGAGGVFYEADDTATLSTVLTDIVRTILDFNTSFTAPAVSVNAFNRTQNLDELYVTVFRPSETYSWDGNIKKYKLRADGTIVDVNDAPAVELTTGFFRTTAQSFWSAGVDGDSVSLGGAANELPSPGLRKVYTDVNPASALTAVSNELLTTNTSITTAMLGLGATESPGRDNLINWLRGMDIDDGDGDGLTTDARLQMGDPMHGRPGTVIYGGTVANPDPTDGVVYAVTNEGFLHAIDTVDGNELWAFMPRQMLARARNMFVNDAVSDRVYGLDGNIRVIRNEVNTNGVVEPALGERVLLVFGMRRGGSEYYGLDVTDRNAPTLLWKIGPNEAGSKQLTNGGQSWSTPSVARVNINGATQNTLQQVLVFGGGYDTVQDNGPYATDSSGNQIFMVDSISGNVLWYAGPSTDAGADLKHASMTHGVPADVRVIDLTGDGFADRMYAADVGGRVWRFDVHNGQTRANLVTGGVFASLGNAHLGTHPVSTTRRFYNAPDVSFLTAGGKTWLNIALGSGYRGHPLNLDTEDRFYSLRDHLPFARLTQTQYDTATVMTEADVNLIDVTDDIETVVPPGASGWRLDLRRPGAGFSGEKSLAESRTIQSMIQFTTYEPNSASTAQSTSCAPGVGTNRLYTVSAHTGAPVYDRESATDPDGDDDGDGIPNSSDDDDDGDGVPDDEEVGDSADDRDTELAQGGIAPETVHIFLEDSTPCLVGIEACDPLPNRVPVRTFWRQTGVN